jgi:transposase
LLEKSLLLFRTRTIPIVFANVGDPVASGIVALLDRPSGNVTGFATSICQSGRRPEHFSSAFFSGSRPTHPRPTPPGTPPRPCWAPKGVRPDVACQLIREFTYLYGAVCPKDGTCVFLILPTADTECFQIFLNTLAKKYSRSHILLFVDGAGNHNSGGLVIPSNITLSPLPAYSPELNPQENIWDEIREKDLQKLCPQIDGRSV